MSTPSNSKLENAEDRARMARTFERGLTKPSGYVLPVQRWNAVAGTGWVSEKWSFRRGKLFLIPGDSPVGYRLPLGSLPWIAPAAYPYIHEADPLIDRDPLPDPDDIAQAYERTGVDARRPEVQQRLTYGASVRTALSIEPRDGKLCVFMPPVAWLEELSRPPHRHRGDGRRKLRACRCTSRAMRRPSIRASMSSRSPRTRA